MQGGGWYWAEAGAPPVITVVAADDNKRRVIGLVEQRVRRFACDEDRFDLDVRVALHQRCKIVV